MRTSRSTASCPPLSATDTASGSPGADQAAFPAWIPYPVISITVGIGLVVALQRHLFSPPSWALLAVVAAVSPWPFLTRPESSAPRWPVVRNVVASGVVMGATLWLVIADPDSVDFAPFFLVLLAGCIASIAGPQYGAAVAVASAASLVALDILHDFTASGIWCFALAVAWMSGAALRMQVRTLSQLRAAQATLSEVAATEERQRLAREIHDLIAHSLAVTMLHLTGARLALDHGDVTDAREGLEEAERAGRRAMTEIRRTVGLLEPEQGVGAAAPTPSAGDLPALIEDFRAAGLHVDARLDGDLQAAPLAAGLALYRIAQESLANAVKHAPGHAVRLRVAADPGELRLTVDNALPATWSAGAGGHGVTGMGERAALLGGRCTAGPVDGAWRVEAAIPLGRDAAAFGRGAPALGHGAPARDGDPR